MSPFVYSSVGFRQKNQTHSFYQFSNYRVKVQGGTGARLRETTVAARAQNPDISFASYLPEPPQEPEGITKLSPQKWKDVMLQMGSGLMTHSP